MSPETSNSAYAILPRARRAAFCALLAFASVSAQGKEPEALRSMRLLIAGHADTVLPVVWDTRGHQDGVIDIGFGSDFHSIMTEHPAATLVLEVKATDSGATITVRQRSVSYLNVGDEGPHVAVPGSEKRGAWVRLPALPDGQFRLRTSPEQVIEMRYSQFAAALGNEQRWVGLMKACRAANDGACYVVTDPELEVSVLDRKGRVTRKIVRITNPNGC